MTLAVGQGSFSELPHAPIWQFIGGLCGAYVVFSFALCTPRLGVVMAMTLVMLGQLMGGIVVDTLGLFEAEAIPLAANRIISICLLLVGVVFTYLGNKQARKNTGYVDGDALPPVKRSRFYIVMMFVGGVLCAIQAPVNTALSRHVGTLEATCVNFTVGLILLFTIVLVVQKGKFNKLSGTKPWQYLGGIYGVVAVTSTVLVTAQLGVGLTMGCAMFGQLASGLLVDSLGLLQVPKLKLNVLRCIGAALVLVGIIMFRM